MSKQLRYYNKKTDRFRLRNHKVTEDNGSSSNIIIVASQEYSFHLFLGSWNKKKTNIRSYEVGVTKFCLEAAVEEADKDSTDSEARA